MWLSFWWTFILVGKLENHFNKQIHWCTCRRLPGVCSLGFSVRWTSSKHWIWSQWVTDTGQRYSTMPRLLTTEQKKILKEARDLCISLRGCHNQIPQIWCLKQQNLFSHNFGGWKFKIKVLTGLVSCEDSLPGLQKASFSLCPYIAFLLCVYSWCLFLFL